MSHSAANAPELIFLCGFIGCIAVDVVAAAKVFESHTIVVPDRYKKLGFYLIRLLMALIAGGLAVAYEIDKPLLAANIGAATPLIIQAFAQGVGGLATATTPAAAVPPATGTTALPTPPVVAANAPPPVNTQSTNSSN